MMPRSTLLLASLLAGCAAAHPEPMPPAAHELGDRVRVRIAGRGDEPSITTADYFLYFVVIGPDGRRQPCRIYAPETAESEGVAGMVRARINAGFGLEGWNFAESLHGDASRCEDAVLPAGFRLCFEPGSYFAYRVAGRTRRMTADLAPEIGIGQITADGSRYVELRPAGGPELERAADPPGWPPPAPRRALE